MPNLVQNGCTMMCPHGAQVLVVPSQSRVTLGGQPALLPADAAQVAGCPFTIGPNPSPCIRVQWSALATRVTIQSQAPLLSSSIGLCQSAQGLIQGVVQMMGVQTKVEAM